jgi:hypothetical protein
MIKVKRLGYRLPLFGILEVMVTVDLKAMQNRFDPETDLTLIDPALD